MPVAFIAADMASSDDPSSAEHGLALLDDLLRELNGDRRHWMTASEMAHAIATGAGTRR